MKRLQRIILSTLTLLLVGFSLTAQNSREFASFIGEKGTYLDQEMGKKGYMFIKADKSNYDSYTYWWNYNTRKCVIARTSDGRIASIIDAMAFDCNQSSGNDNSYNYQHSAHHHENQVHYTDENADKAFDRGYSDGLHNMSYHNIYTQEQATVGYAHGYTEGVEQRKRNTNYHSGSGGYKKHVQVDTMVGMDTNNAFNQLQSSGFVKQSERTQNDRKRVNWYNRNTGQCIKTILDNGRIFKVENSDGCD